MAPPENNLALFLDRQPYFPVSGHHDIYGEEIFPFAGKLEGLVENNFVNALILFIRAMGFLPMIMTLSPLCILTRLLQRSR